MLVLPVAGHSASVEVEARGNLALQAAVRDSLNLPALVEADPTPETVATAAEVERERLTELVRGLGYLDAMVDVQLQPQSGGDSDPHLSIEVEPGPEYRIGWVAVAGPEGGSLSTFDADLGAVVARSAGDVADRDELSSLEAALLRLLRDRGRPDARIVSRALKPDPGSRTVGVEIVLDPGAETVFGEVTFEGSYHYGPEDLAGLVPFAAGDLYRRSDLDAFRAALEDLQAFRRVRVSDEPAGEGVRDISVTLRDRSPDPDDLASSGATGLGVIALALAAVGVRQVAMAAGTRSGRTLLWLNLAVAALLLASLLFIAARLSNFLP